MGIVSSTFASLALQLAWNYQRLLDPGYRCLEGEKLAPEESRGDRELGIVVAERNCEKSSSSSSTTSSSSLSGQLTLSEIRGRRRRAIIRQRYRKRPASFDTAWIANRSDDPLTLNLTCVVTSTPSSANNHPGAPRPTFWDVTSSSGCSSDSGSYLDSDSEVEDRLNEAFIDRCGELDCTEDEKERFAMSAEEQTAFRMTVGRGHFSRSKKDRFLNHLRLEKRLNILNNSFTHTNIIRGHGCPTLERRYSGDLYRITY